MTRRKELKGIARDLIHSLSSRNNDYLGYWATGQLYKFACESQTDTIVINVLSETMEPRSKIFEPLCENYKSLFKKHMEARNMPFEWLKNVTIEYAFNQEHNPKLHLWVGVGKPYIIRLTIVTDLNQEFKQEAGGYCREHDPSREHKSLRAKASNK